MYVCSVLSIGKEGLSEFIWREGLIIKGNKMYSNLNSKVLNYIIIYTIIVVKEKYYYT